MKIFVCVLALLAVAPGCGCKRDEGGREITVVGTSVDCPDGKCEAKKKAELIEWDEQK